MDGKNLHKSLHVLEEKITQLLACYKDREALVNKLQDENTYLRAQIANDLAEVSGASNNLQSTTFAGTSNKTKEWEHTLAHCIDDVDQCIAYLEQL